MDNDYSGYESAYREDLGTMEGETHAIFRPASGRQSTIVTYLATLEPALGKEQRSSYTWFSYQATAPNSVQLPEPYIHIGQIPLFTCQNV